MCYISFLPYEIQLSRKEIEEIYGTRRIGRDQARELVGLMDFFCFSEVSFVILHCFSTTYYVLAGGAAVVSGMCWGGVQTWPLDAASLSSFILYMSNIFIQIFFWLRPCMKHVAHVTDMHLLCKFVRKEFTQ